MAAWIFFRTKSASPCLIMKHVDIIYIGEFWSIELWEGVSVCGIRDGTDHIIFRGSLNRWKKQQFLNMWFQQVNELSIVLKILSFNNYNWRCQFSQRLFEFNSKKSRERRIYYRRIFSDQHCFEAIVEDQAFVFWGFYETSLQ